MVDFSLWRRFIHFISYFRPVFFLFPFAADRFASYFVSHASSTAFMYLHFCSRFSHGAEYFCPFFFSYFALIWFMIFSFLHIFFPIHLCRSLIRRRYERLIFRSPCVCVSFMWQFRSILHAVHVRRRKQKSRRCSVWLFVRHFRLCRFKIDSWTRTFSTLARSAVGQMLRSNWSKWLAIRRRHKVYTNARAVFDAIEPTRQRQSSGMRDEVCLWRQTANAKSSNNERMICS